jgi:hypothetical protein
VVLLEEDYCIVLHIPGISDFILDFKLIYIYILNLKMVEAVLFGLFWAGANHYTIDAVLRF